jgi:hypothetical protein
MAASKVSTAERRRFLVRWPVTGRDLDGGIAALSISGLMRQIGR